MPAALQNVRTARPIANAALCLLAFHNRFIQDDAFITFRYASHLAQGLGPVWNPGERVEGYTDFLWMLLMAIPHALGLDPIAFAQGTGLALFAGTLLVTDRLARRVLGSEGWALLAVLLLGTNYTFSAYATGGLETQLQALLVTAAATLALGAVMDERPNETRWASLSLVSAAALLTRLDSALPLAALLPAVIRRVGTSDGEPHGRGRALALLLGPMILITGSWLAWKAVYYGDLLPNTFYAKAPVWGVLRRGLRYAYQFFIEYALLPVLLIVALRAGRLFRDRASRLLLVAVSIWGVYVVAFGGDFMEFRFMVPLMPIGWVVAVKALASMRGRALSLAVSLLVIAASWLHAIGYRGVSGIESIRGLESHVIGEDDWRGIGTALGALFPGESNDVLIATSAAGAIPYYSGLRSLDMLGLCDRWVARHGAPVGTRSGHRRIATHAYLHQRGVNLVVGLPLLPPRAGTGARDSLTTLRDFWVVEARPRLLPETARIVEVPVGARRLRLLYLEPGPRVDGVIRAKGLATFPIATD